MCKRKRPKYHVGDILEHWTQTIFGPHRTSHYIVVGIEWWGNKKQYYDYVLKPLDLSAPPESYDRDDVELVDWVWWQRKCRSGYRKVG